MVQHHMAGKLMQESPVVHRGSQFKRVPSPVALCMHVPPRAGGGRLEAHSRPRLVGTPTNGSRCKRGGGGLGGGTSKKMDTADIFLVSVWKPWLRWPPWGRSSPMMRSWGASSAVNTCAPPAPRCFS